MSFDFSLKTLRDLLLKPQGHKYQHGHALVLAGGMGRTGAARLAARGALRIGAGVVTLGAPDEAMTECAAQISALMLRRIDTGEDLTAALQDRRINALCMGPGLGVQRAGAMLAALHAAAPGYRGALVLDADALTALAPQPVTLPANCVLTPHDGEFARLFPDLSARLGEPALRGPAAWRLDATLEAANRTGAVVLLKGPDTVIAAPDGRLALHRAAGSRAVPWLATAGAGDVLAGIITGLLARGTAAFEAACAGAWIHVEAARIFGPGLIADDLLDTLPAALRSLQSPRETDEDVDRGLLP